MRRSNAYRRKREERLMGLMALGALLVAAVGALAAATGAVEWGPKGYDHGGAGRAFAAQLSYDGAAVELRVDAQETAAEVGSVVLKGKGFEVRSAACGKAERHIDAPWACSFSPAELSARRGSGILQVFDRSGKRLLAGEVSFDRLRALAARAGKAVRPAKPARRGLVESIP